LHSAGASPSSSNNVHESIVACPEGAKHEPLLELVLSVYLEEKRSVIQVGVG
jgi:hypothetical protein